MTPPPVRFGVVPLAATHCQLNCHVLGRSFCPLPTFLCVTFPAPSSPDDCWGPTIVNGTTVPFSLVTPTLFHRTSAVGIDLFPEPSGCHPVFSYPSATRPHFVYVAENLIRHSSCNSFLPPNYSAKAWPRTSDASSHAPAPSLPLNTPPCHYLHSLSLSAKDRQSSQAYDVSVRITLVNRAQHTGG